MANNYVLWLYLKVLRSLHTLKRASFATSPISRMELSICSVSSQQTTEECMCCTTRWVQKILKRTYIFAHTIFAFEMKLISLFYKMYYNIRPGLGLLCVIVVFSNQTRLFFWSLICPVGCKRIKMHYGRHRKCRRAVFFFILFFFKVSLLLQLQRWEIII